MIRAIVSIGTNSTRILIADLSKSHPHILYANSIGSRIGEGLQDKGRLHEAAMHRTLDAVREHYRAIQDRFDSVLANKTNLFAVATSALRRASNSGTFSRAIENILGVPMRILSGEEEAVASYRGAVTAISTNTVASTDTIPGKTEPHYPSVGVLDMGGGSTEYAIGHGTIPERVVSCEIGAVRLTEACLQLAGASAPTAITRARSIARSLMTPIADFPHVEELIVVGGSASTAVSLLQGHREPFETRIITRSDINALFERLVALSLDERKQLPGMNPQRADILPAGLIILDTVFEITAHEKATATTFDLPLGYLLIQNQARHD